MFIKTPKVYGSTDPGADVIDFRDITARVEELRDERDACTLLRDGEEGETIEEPDPEGWAAQYPDDAEELARLEKLLEETGGYGGDHQWEGTWYPGSMIADDHFEDYARQLADDIGAVKDDAGWPSSFIDWPRAAEALKQDYSSITYGGVEYWYR